MQPFDPRANRNTYWAHVFVEALARNGLRTAVVAPGARSAPLVLALAAHPAVRVVTIVDERSAGFFAVGHARASGHPVAIVCTSGTAAANFHPAVIEAALGQVPLIVLTADRPVSLRDTGAGQAIDQLKLYGDAVRWFCEVGAPQMDALPLRHLRSLAARALQQSMGPLPGPVHLNFPFDKPLEPTPVPGDVPAELEAAATLDGAAHADGAPFSRGHAGRMAASPQTVARLAELVRRHPRGLIVCGPMHPAQSAPGAPDAARWPQAVAGLAHSTGYPLLAEPTSQVRSGPHDRSHVLAHGEALLRSAPLRARLRPELLLRFGGMPTAKGVELLLDEAPACRVVVVNAGGTWLEPTHHPAEIVSAEPLGLCEDLCEALGAGRAGGAWLDAWQAAEQTTADALEAWRGGLVAAGRWFEGQVFAELAALLPAEAVQVTASSMPVRDLDAFTPGTPRRVWHLVNRGANGIDGTLSTALGAAAATEAPTVLVTGDLALFHDANGLLTAGAARIPLTIVLINNGGGGIFEFLPIADYGAAYEEHFVTPHTIDFAALAAAYGVAHVRPATWADFRREVRESLARPGPRIIELRTQRQENRALHREAWEVAAEALAQRFPGAAPLG